MTRTKKSPLESQIEMRELVMPHHTNPHHTIFGGTVMSWVDIAAAMASARHANAHVVTVHVDDISFKEPVKLGDQVVIRASVNYVGQTSMEVGVRVESEDPITNTKKLTTQAYLTFVALDELGNPKVVPELDLKTDEEKRRHENAKKRVMARKKLQKSLT